MQKQFKKKQIGSRYILKTYIQIYTYIYIYIKYKDNFITYRTKN